MGEEAFFDLDPATSSAVLSPDGLYRYQLTRTWRPGSYLTFIMLNPSTADAEKDDLTIRRCIGFAKREGLGGLRVVNLYALRSTDPAALWTHPDPVGPENDMHLQWALWDAAASDLPVVAAWGALARPDRVAAVQALGDFQVSALGVTKDGAPRHPSRLRADTPLVPWEAR